MFEMKIVSLNVRGLQNVQKRKRLTEALVAMDPDVLVLQETRHCKPDILVVVIV